MAEMKLQKEYCEINNLPFFAPDNGICWHCKYKIPDTNKKLITGCPNCNTTFCD
jgi:hypothetical protein